MEHEDKPDAKAALEMYMDVINYMDVVDMHWDERKQLAELVCKLVDTLFTLTTEVDNG